VLSNFPYYKLSRQRRQIGPEGAGEAPGKPNEMPDSLTVLMVEDNPTDILLIEHAFKRAKLGGSFKSVNKADEAYRWLMERLDNGESLPDLVMLDLNLPEESGMEMLAKLKSTPRLSEMKIVVFSGSESHQDMAKARSLGADWYFVKQADVRDLDLIVQQLERLCAPQ
jgi:CheY-like chemotaxis protein